MLGSMLNIIVSLLIISGSACARPDKTSDVYMHPPPIAHSRFLNVNPAENTAEYWNIKAQQTLAQKLSKKLNQNEAKNIILFLGDGMSIPTVSAARVYLGGEELQLSFDNFPYTALSKTYAVNKQVADSANTATAYLGGVKGNYGTIGVTGAVQYGDCEAMTDANNHVLSIGYHAQKSGKKTGLVTTARVTHASPAGVYAHTANRNWECDTDILNANLDPNVCKDIATQLIYGETGKNLDVIMGGGRKEFLPKNKIDEDGDEGNRSDNVNLIDEWLSLNHGQYVANRTQLSKAVTTADKLLGLFASDHIDYNIDRDVEKVPSLEEMTEAAIKILSRGFNGYFLFVEGARIDMAHHNNNAMKAMNETIEFSKAIAKAVELTDESDTLIVVTADHAHTMSYSGYADRGNNILEYGGIADDLLVYTTLNYANGPGYQSEINGHRYDFSKNNIDDKELKYPAIAPLSSETHGGDDVGVYAYGPWAHLYSGVIEENVIPHIMMYAACIGDGIHACRSKH